MIVLFRIVSTNQNLSAQYNHQQELTPTISFQLPYPPPITESPPDQANSTITPSNVPNPPSSDYSTLTPFPTPTIRPGPTEKAEPLPSPAYDPNGLILYSTIKSTQNPDFPDFFTYTYSNFALQVSAAGEIRPSEEMNTFLDELNAQLGYQISSIYPSPNGNIWILFASSESGSIPFIYDFTKRTGAWHFTEYGGGRFFGWHPDSRRFLFWVEGVALWLVDAVTLQTTSLAVGSQSYLQGAAISPTGQQVAFIAQDGDSYALWITGSSGVDAKRLFDSGPQSYLSPTAWSPDGTQIAYVGICTENADEVPAGGPLCLYDLISGERRALNIPFSGGDPVWSPDSQFIAGTGYSPGKDSCYRAGMSVQEAETCFYDVRSIFLELVSKGSVTELAKGIEPVWSPDGSMIAFLSNQSGFPEVWTIRRDGSGLRQVTDDGLLNAWLIIRPTVITAWSPDDLYVVVP
jgi:WD40 repeat protein